MLPHKLRCVTTRTKPLNHHRWKIFSRGEIVKHVKCLARVRFSSTRFFFQKQTSHETHHVLFVAQETFRLRATTHETICRMINLYHLRLTSLCEICAPLRGCRQMSALRVMSYFAQNCECTDTSALEMSGNTPPRWKLCRLCAQIRTLSTKL